MGFLGRLFGQRIETAPSGVFPVLPSGALPSGPHAAGAPATGEISLVSVSKPAWSYGLESLPGLLPPKIGAARRIAFAQLATPGLADLRERLAGPEDDLGRFARGFPAWLAETLYFSDRYAPISVAAVLDSSRHVLLPEPWSPANIRQLVDTSQDGLDYVVTGTLAETSGGERTLVLSLWDIARFEERKAWSLRWRPETADDELASFHQHFRLFMEWSPCPAGAGIEYVPTRHPSAWGRTLGTCISLLLAEKGTLSRESIEFKADMLNLVAEQAVTGETASLAWLTLSARARSLGLVSELAPVQLLPTAIVKAASALTRN
jgi:hypothetical protein